MSFSTLFALGYYIVSAIALAHLFWLRKRPAATLAWAWGILLFPYLGALFYWGIGADRLRRKRLHRRAGFHSLWAGQPAVDDVSELPEEDAVFSRQISRLNDIPATQAAQAWLLPEANTFYDALCARIAAARHHVHIQFFIWRADPTGDRLRDALLAAARRGVRVRVLLDEVGSVTLSARYFQPIVAAGGEFSWFLTINPRRHRYLFNLRNHRKLQIIDGRHAFVGGMNVGREYQGLDPAVGPWRDLQVELEGPVARILQESFADDWYFSTGKKIGEPGYYPQTSAEAAWPALVIAGGPDSPSSPMQKSLIAVINRARRRLWLATGYFVPNQATLIALQLCAARGVDVRLLITEKTDHPALLRIGRSFYDDLLSAGVRIFEYSPALHHTKAGVIDDEWLLVGSANIDNRSMHVNFELSVLLRMPPLVAALAGQLETDFAACTEIDAVTFARRPLREKIYESICRPFAPLL
ncbi:MAG: cardiolipin synthase [Verrucomicrobia bacterium]|nr:cardiolipin synthase [Verrucomicrobiota bacterium]